MGGKNIAVGAVLLVVIVVAFIVVAKRTGIVSSKPEVPAIVMAQKFMKITTKAPFKEVTLSLTEWDKLGHDEQLRYKNPESKEFDMVGPIMCASCQKRIPEAVYPTEVLAITPPDKQAQEMIRIRNEYKCPLCSKAAYLFEKW